MATTYVQTLPSANISRLSSAVSDMQVEVSSLDQQVGSLSNHARSIETSTNAFLDEFHKFLEQNKRDQQLHEAIADQVQLQQELENKFSQHQKARGYVTGILQATDLSLVRKQTMQDCTEELMLAVPHYWLVPALVALSSWLNNDKPLAERALHEALRRDDEKTTFKAFSWADQFLTGDVYILGLGMYLCESDLWYLICNKKRNFPDRKTYYYAKEAPDKTIRIMLETYGVQIIGENDLGISGEYMDFYNAALTDIKNKSGK